MHFYPQNIADYRKKTMGLSPLEHGIYRLLMDTYYLTEQPLELDLEELMRSHSVRTENEQLSFKYILKKYFKKTPEGYRNSRCDKEIEAFYEKSEKARQSAKARWAKNHNTDAMRSHSDGNADGMLPQYLNTSIPQYPLPTTPVSKTKNKVKNLPGEPVQKKDVAEPELQAASKATWHAYGKAYFARYNTEPVRNAKVSSMIKLFVQRIGMVEAPMVAAFYVAHNEKFYVQKSHPVDLMLKDAEGLRTQWVTGQSMTGTRAGQIDKSQANFSAVGEAQKILEARQNAKTT